MFIIRNIGLEGSNDNSLVLSSGNQYDISEDPSQYCQSTLKSLTIGQKQICLLHADHMPIVIQGIFFVWKKWESKRWARRKEFEIY